MRVLAVFESDHASAVGAKPEGTISTFNESANIITVSAFVFLLVENRESDAAGQPAQDLFQKLLAEPLAIRRYYLMLSPAGDFALSGSARFLPLDFMKLGQLHLNDGRWNGRRIFTPEGSRRATSSLIQIGGSKRKYGYLWWVNEYPYKGRTVRAYFAAGNGGQIVMAIPDLDLVLAFYGGSYNDAGGYKATDVYIPEYILPAIDK